MLPDLFSPRVGPLSLPRLHGTNVGGKGAWVPFLNLEQAPTCRETPVCRIQENPPAGDSPGTCLQSTDRGTPHRGFLLCLYVLSGPKGSCKKSTSGTSTPIILLSLGQEPGASGVGDSRLMPQVGAVHLGPISPRIQPLTPEGVSVWSSGRVWAVSGSPQSLGIIRQMSAI